MVRFNTAEQSEFFKAIGAADIERIRTLVANDRSLLDCFDHRNFGATPLTAACFGNQLQVVATLIELGADPNKRSDWSMGPWSPLHCAVYRRDHPLAEYLLSHGARMDVHTAAGLGRVEAVRELLAKDPDRVREKGGDGCQPLHFADSIAVAQLLIDYGADINARCIDHYSTPAQYLCTARPEVARYLLTHGAMPDVFSAVACGADELLSELLDANPEWINARINQSFFPPSQQFDVHNVLTFTIGLDATPLHVAAKSNRTAAVELLVRRGISPDVRGGYDQGAPLHTAAWNNCAESAAALLDNGADINLKSGKLHNNSPAGWAIVAGSPAVFELLLYRGAAIFPWFIDDARDACAGRFNAVSRATPEQRAGILALLTRKLSDTQ